MGSPLRGLVLSGYGLWYPVGSVDDDRRYYTLTGIASLSLKGEGGSWHREPCTIDVGIPDLPTGKGLVLEQWAPIVTLNSIANEQASIEAGWAVDNFDVQFARGKAVNVVSVQADLAVRDVDGFILRLGYAVHLIGRLGDLSPAL
jgi:hypothetical protein